MWDITVGGSAIADETSQQAAEREVKEEIGYTLNLRNRRPALTNHSVKTLLSFAVSSRNPNRLCIAFQ